MNGIFAKVYTNNLWGGKESRSGKGSDSENTAFIKVALRMFFHKINFHKVIDLGCGDFNWMGDVLEDVKTIDYLGIDIVDEMITDNKRKYGSDNIKFRAGDITDDPLEKAGLVFCRDCMVHLSFEDNMRLLKNIKSARIPFLMATTFSNQDRENKDISTGEWRTLNLEKAPFNFERPLHIINERYHKEEEAFADKSLALWEMSSIEVD